MIRNNLKINSLKNKISMIILACAFIGCANSQVKDEEIRVKQTYKVEQTQADRDLAILYGEDDPLGALNRRIYYFNGTADRYVIKPVMMKYKYYALNFFQKRFSNFFTNFQNIGYALNSFLQLELTEGIETVVRFGVNSTVGILGLFDPATTMGIPKHKETMGLTMAHYGVGRGAYVVLPLLGPSNIRDSAGMVANSFAVNKLDVYHPVHIDFSEYYMLALYGFSVKADTGIYFMDSDYVFEYEYARFLSKKYLDLMEKRDKKIN